MKTFLKNWAQACLNILTVVIGYPLYLAVMVWSIIGWAASVILAIKSPPAGAISAILWVVALGWAIAFHKE